MSLNLGSVNFGLGADTAGLKKATRQLQEFGKQIDKVAQDQSRQGQQTASALAKQEAAIRKALQQVLSLNQQLRQTGAPLHDLSRNTKAFQQFTKAMSSGKLSTVEFLRAQDRMSAQLGKSRRSLQQHRQAAAGAAAGTGSLLTRVRDLESASVLAVGPLSGLGARIRALASITSRGSLGIALFFGAITAAVVTVVKLTKAAINAQRELEQIEVAFIAALGSAAAARAEFEFVKRITSEMGIALRNTARQYARLNAAAAGAAIKQEEIRELFEGVAAAASVFNLESQELEGVMRALEQMMSKGIVSSDELRRQFALRIPGAMKIAADAMGVTEEQFNRMLARGEIMAVDLLPKLGKQLKETFGEQALEAAGNMESSVQRLSSEAFLFSLALDEVIGASKVFQDVTNALTKSIQFMTNNIDRTVRAIGGLATGFGTMMIISRVQAAAAAYGGTLQMLIALKARLTAVTNSATTSMRAFGMALPGGVVVRLLAGLATMAGVMKLMERNMDDGAGAAVDLRNRLDEIIHFGEDADHRFLREANASLEQAERQAEQARKKVVDFHDEIARQRRVVARLEDLPAMRGGEPRPLIEARKRLEELREQAQEASGDFAKWESDIELAKTRVDELEESMKGVSGLSKEAEKAMKAMADQVRTLGQTRQLTQLVDQNASAKAIQSLRDIHAAQNLIKDVPDAEIDQLRKSLNELGIQGDDVVEMLARITRSQREYTKTLEDHAAAQQASESAHKDITQAISAMTRELDAARQGMEVYDKFEAMEKQRQQVEEWRKALEGAGQVSGIMINSLIGLWTGLSEATEGARKELEEYRKFVKSGETDKAIADVAMEMQRLTHETAAANQGLKAYNQHLEAMQRADALIAIHNKLIEAGVEQERVNELVRDFGKAWDENQVATQRIEQMQSLVQELERSFKKSMDDIGKAISEAFVRGEDSAISFRNIVRAMLQSIIQAITKTIIMQSILNSLMGMGGSASVGSGAANTFAKGGAFTKGKLHKFARGGIVDSPTMFPMKGGTGMMGEAGSEAIMPLTRTRNGELGVRAESAGSTIIVQGDNIDARNMTPETLAQFMPLLRARDERLREQIARMQDRRRRV